MRHADFRNWQMGRPHHSRAKHIACGYRHHHHGNQVQRTAQVPWPWQIPVIMQPPSMTSIDCSNTAKSNTCSPSKPVILHLPELEKRMSIPVLKLWMTAAFWQYKISLGRPATAQLQYCIDGCTINGLKKQNYMPLKFVAYSHCLVVVSPY